MFASFFKSYDLIYDLTFPTTNPFSIQKSTDSTFCCFLQNEIIIYIKMNVHIYYFIYQGLNDNWMSIYKLFLWIHFQKLFFLNQQTNKSKCYDVQAPAASVASKQQNYFRLLACPMFKSVLPIFFSKNELSFTQHPLVNLIYWLHLQRYIYFKEPNEKTA